MRVFKKWWKRALEIGDWHHGEKHPDTDPTIFKNVWGYDLVRRVLKSRCHECGYAVSDDEKDVQELFYTCSHKDCDCSRMGTSRIHRLCGVCANMWRALYLNKLLANKDYFLNLNRVKPDKGDWRMNRDKLGL